jgi:HK97 family phage major capsid protein
MPAGLAPGAVQASLRPINVPRAIMPAHIQAHGGGGNPNAGSPAAVIAELQAGFEAFQARHDQALDQVQTAVDQISARIAAGQMQPGAGADPVPDRPYSTLFANWARRGHGEAELSDANAQGDRARIRAAMTTGSNGDGGYLAPVEWDRRIVKALTSVSPLRQLCTVVTTTIGAYSTVWNGGGWGSGWVGETASRPATSTPALGSIVFNTGEIYANPALSQQLLEDAAFKIEDWLAGEVGEEFAKQEAIAFVSGNGTNKPFGFLSYVGTGTSVHPGGEPGVTNSGAASSLGGGDGLIDLVFALAAPYRAGAAWLMNSATTAAVRKLKDGQGNYLWQPSYIVGSPPTLLGYPVFTDETMPDVAAGALPIAFGNWSRFYVINDRLGTSILRDPYTNKPFVQFYTRKRVGGGILDPKAVRLLKIAANS